MCALEFVDRARDGRYLLTLGDNKIWLHIDREDGHKALVDDASEAGAGALGARSQFLCNPVRSCIV